MKTGPGNVFSRPLILIGMPGAGKSFWAQHLATAWSREMIDLDREIEVAAGKSVLNLFRAEGEVGFRQREAKMLQGILQKKTPFILATGGGTPCFGENLKWMLRAGTVVYLKAPVTLLTQRILAQKDVRPLLQNLSEESLLEKLLQTLHVRETFYRKAHHTLPAEGLSEAIFAAL